MKLYKQRFIEFALKHGALRFGEFQLKSGRHSPYFFNTGIFNTGKNLALLGNFYAEALIDSTLSYDVIFGPAYKGIPIVSATVIALTKNHNMNVPYCFNRKEVKDHGEGGQLVGMPIDNKRVILIDDVITAGTAVHQSMVLLEKNNAQLSGVLVSFDRQEKGGTEESAIQEIEQRYQCPVISIITIDDLIDFLHNNDSQSTQLKKIRAYRDKYGVIQ